MQIGAQERARFREEVRQALDDVFKAERPALRDKAGWAVAIAAAAGLALAAAGGACVGALVASQRFDQDNCRARIEARAP